MGDDKKSENPQYAQQGGAYPMVPGQQYTYPGQPLHPAPGYSYPTTPIPGQLPYQYGQYPNMPQGGYQTYTQQPYYPQTGIPMQDVHQSTPTNRNFTTGQDGFMPNRPGRGIKHMNTYTMFSDESVRRAFVRKVYTVMTMQLTLSTLLIMIFVLVEPVKLWVQTHLFIYYIAFAVFIVVYIVLICCANVRRRYPQNYICLFIFTLALSYMVGVISSIHKTPVVMMAFGMTAALTLIITLFAMFTKLDFTKCYAFFAFISIAFFIFGIACIIVFALYGRNKILLAVYSGIGVVVFSLFLCFDTQMILGGRSHEYSEEEYITAALDLYLDIVNMFLMILQLTGLANE